jgi:membrane associated rhomboid family serine protease/Zn-finger nucleic acid-binding protein
MQCPICKKPFVSISIHGIEIDSCTGCFGIWFEKNELPEFLEKLENGELSGGPKEVSTLSPATENRKRERSFCPKFNQLVSPLTVGNSDITVLRCANCRGIWVEPSQIKSLRDWYKNAKVSERLSIHALPREPALNVVDRAPALKAIFNLVEAEVDRKNFPAITVFIILVNILLFIWSYFYPHKAWMFWNIPESISKFPFVYTYTLLSSMFMHGGIFHLIFNMYFLWIFGNNIEDRIGPAKYVVFYLSCGIFAGLIHTFLTGHPELPTLGASGAVSGIMGGYLYLYPRAKLTFHTLIIWRPLKFRLPVWFYLGVWFFGSQIIYAALAIPGTAWYAHIAGFIFGFGVMFGMRKLNYL